MAKVDLAEVVDLVRSQLAENWHHDDAQHREYLVAQAVAARSNAVLSDSVKALTLRIRVKLWDQTWIAWLAFAVAAFAAAWLTGWLGTFFGWPLFVISFFLFGAAIFLTWRMFCFLSAQQRGLLNECDVAEAGVAREQSSNGDRLPAVRDAVEPNSSPR